MLSETTIAELDTFLLELNRVSADVILPLFRAPNVVEDKGGVRGFDPVTAADRGAEDAIRRLIASRYPEHGVIGEERGEDRPGADFVWVIDPIDGTRAFVAGLPLWTTLIALRFEGRPVLGSIGQPYVGEVYMGKPGGSRVVTSRGTSRLAVRPCSSLSTAIIATTDPDVYFGDAERAAWANLRRTARIARTGCDAYAYAMVASGTMDLVVEASLKAWDVEAAIPVLEGAGGSVTTWTRATVGDAGGQIAFAGDHRCLDEALEVLRPAASAEKQLRNG
jgi:histidinol phosphatase-like enzyme (inositol monophosphatase family)